jgi:hypothetical protein
MTRRTRLVRTIGAAVLAVGISAQAAQAKPYEAPPGAIPAAARIVTMQATSGVLPWSPARAHYSSVPAVSPHTGAYLPVGTGSTPTTPAVDQASDGVSWGAIMGGVAIVGLVGALGALAFRLRPGRAATA